MRAHLKEATEAYSGLDDAIHPISREDSEIIDRLLVILEKKGDLVSDVLGVLSSWKLASDRIVLKEIDDVMRLCEEGLDRTPMITVCDQSIPLKIVRTLKSEESYDYNASTKDYFLVINKAESDKKDPVNCNIRLKFISALARAKAEKEIKALMEKFGCKFTNI